MNPTEDSFSSRRALRVLRRRAGTIVALLAAGAGAGALLALDEPERYEAAATIVVGSTLTGGDAQGGLTADAAARLVRTRGVATRVRRDLGGVRTQSDLLGAIEARPDASGAFVDVVAEAGSAEEAVELANAFAEQFVAGRAALRSERRDPRSTAIPRAVDAGIVDPAVSAGEQNEDALVRWTVAGAGLGLLLGVTLAFSLEALDPRVRALEELRRLVPAPQLAALAPLPRRGGRRGRPRVLALSPEPLEHLRGALLALDGGRPLERVVVTSPADRKEGKTAVAAGLALSLARLGLRVGAVDADLRAPGLASQFGLDDAATGLSDVVRGAGLDEALQRFELPVAGGDDGARPGRPAELVVVAAGSDRTGVAELLAGPRVREVLEELGRRLDVIVVDCPPVLAASDALPLLEGGSGTILVVRHSHTPRQAVARAASVIADAQGRLLGVVATGAPKGELAAEGSGPWPARGAARDDA